MMDHLEDDIAAVKQCEHEQTEAGEVLHSQQGFLTELAVPAGGAKAEREEPQPGAQRDTGHAGEFAGPVRLDPFA